MTANLRSLAMVLESIAVDAGMPGDERRERPALHYRLLDGSYPERELPAQVLHRLERV